MGRAWPQYGWAMVGPNWHTRSIPIWIFSAGQPGQNPQRDDEAPQQPQGSTKIHKGVGMLYIGLLWFANWEFSRIRHWWKWDSHRGNPEHQPKSRGKLLHDTSAGLSCTLTDYRHSWSCAAVSLNQHSCRTPQLSSKECKNNLPDGFPRKCFYVF